MADVLSDSERQAAINDLTQHLNRGLSGNEQLIEWVSQHQI